MNIIICQQVFKKSGINELILEPFSKLQFLGAYKMRLVSTLKWVIWSHFSLKITVVFRKFGFWIG
jgi:hypothetical protein